MSISPIHWGAASHLATNYNLIEVLRGACSTTEINLDSQGKIVVDWQPRFPVVLLTLKSSINDHSSLKIEGALTLGGSTTSLTAVEFGPFSEAGSALPIYIPTLPPDSPGMSTFSIKLKATVTTEGGTNTSENAKNVVAVHVIEGQLGRLLYATHAEKARIRTLGRKITASRSLNLARQNALDCIGADLGVRRFIDEIKAVKPNSSSPIEVIVVPRGSGTKIGLEPDFEYQNRLSIYNPLYKFNRSKLLAKLNGTAGSDGMLAKLGYKGTVNLEESSAKYAISFHLVQCGTGNDAKNFLKYLKESTLILPAKTPGNNALHGNRYLPTKNKQEIEQVRTDIVKGYTFPNDTALAPMLASGLARASRVCLALGLTDVWTIRRSFSPTDGSRYSMGLGADIVTPDPSFVTKLIASISNSARARTKDAVAEAIIDKLKTHSLPSSGQDPEASWLWEACDMQTCHKLSNNLFYVSHLPTFGLAIAGDSQVNVGANKTVNATYHATLDSGINAALFEIVSNTNIEWVKLGNSAFSVLNQTNAADALKKGVPFAPAAPVLPLLTSAGLTLWKTISDDPTKTMASNQVELRADPTTYVIIELDSSLTTNLIAGKPAAGTKLGDLVEILQRNGLAAMTAFMTSGGKLVFIASAVSLPEVGLNLGEEKTTGIRWYVVPIGRQEDGVSPIGISPNGSSCRFTGNSQGLMCIVALGYARRGFADPYEYRAKVESNKLLNIKQYEFLMNFLEHTYPLGVEVNTYEMRKFGVDLDEDGNPDPLGTTISKTYRKFRTNRTRGYLDTYLEENK